MNDDLGVALGRRERQIMDVIYRRGQASAADVLSELDDPPSYSAVRAMLRYLEGKDLLRHEQTGTRYVYQPVIEKTKARRSALGQVVRNFFDNSVPSAVAALLETKALSQEEFERLSRLLDNAREEGAK